MAKCTAPREGHRSASAAANCPVCGGRYRRNQGYGTSLSYSSLGSIEGSQGNSTRPHWSPARSSVVYTPTEIRALTPIYNSVEKLATLPSLWDVFLCHAWDDRQGAARKLHDRLEERGLQVWSSKKDVGFGVPLLLSIDEGLANARVGIVLVTPALLHRLPTEGITDKDFSELFARDQIIIIVHETTYEALRNVSPLLASRSGLSTAEDSMSTVAAKIAELFGF
nr:toll/interleukin-1 receptor domain-containing protein [Synechococcus elongatus]QFZ92436.1 TIR domain-containing protein [Synechococcus elongatus PCC 11802]